MVSRRDLVRARKLSETEEEEAPVEVPNEVYDERKAAFGDKRDDLFYKTIGRDVRKFLQERFQSVLGGKSLKE